MNTLAGSPALKVQVMCEGIRYTEALGRATQHAMPNYYPYRFKEGEHDPTGRGITTIPYLINTPDGTEIRILGNGDSPWHVEGDLQQGYRLIDDRSGRQVPIEFEPLCPWLTQKTADGLPYAQAGVTTHGDMLVINVAPGCEYFLHKHDGVSMRCGFCAYGAPDERTKHLGQVTGQVEIPQPTLERMREALNAVIDQTEIRHIYLVGGSLTDCAQGRRALPAAGALRQAGQHARHSRWRWGRIASPTTSSRSSTPNGWCSLSASTWRCGPSPCSPRSARARTAYVGYAALDRIAGDGGAPLRPRQRLLGDGGRHRTRARASGWTGTKPRASALEGAEDLCSRGIIPIYSLVWPVGGRQRPDFHARIRSYFETLVTLGYQAIRRRHGLVVSDGFMCHRCAYMQLECDLDRAMPAGGRMIQRCASGRRRLPILLRPSSA
jgi:hypothetical protein